ncbi:DUF3953 domain-containing protein [Acinetobacter courvalinii]|nr:DUF3953 domain-containing protein [Acinetobacter courvalinii]
MFLFVNFKKYNGFIGLLILYASLFCFYVNQFNT